MMYFFDGEYAVIVDHFFILTVMAFTSSVFVNYETIMNCDAVCTIHIKY